MTEKIAPLCDKRTFWSHACRAVLLLLALILVSHMAARLFPQNGTNFVWPQSPMDVRYDAIVLSLILLCAVGIWLSWRGSKLAVMMALTCGLLALAAIFGVIALLLASRDQWDGWH